MDISFHCNNCKKDFDIQSTTRATHCPFCDTWYCLMKWGHIKEQILTESRYSFNFEEYRYKITQDYTNNTTSFSAKKIASYEITGRVEKLFTLNKLMFFSPSEARKFVKNKLKLYTVFS